MPYNRKWGGTQPGCLIILLDQSGSMKNPFGGKRLGAGKKKCDMVASAVNRILFEIVSASQKGANLSPRAEIAVIGYGGDAVRSVLPGALKERLFVTVQELQQNPLRIENHEKERYDDVGKAYIERLYYTLWIDPLAEGATPMCKALNHVSALASGWAATHLDSFPPIAINITDGHASDGNPTGLFEDLLKVGTKDGQLLLFNCHITDKPFPPIEFPCGESELPNDYFARQLFFGSSEIPEETGAAYLSATGNNLPVGARGYIFNGDANSVRRMLVFGTTAAKRR